MKRIIYIELITFLVICYPSKKELFELTDTFVDLLQTTY
jgi:hypothetical protein